jgi:hypothetical protein
VCLSLACWVVALEHQDVLLLALCCCGLALLGLNSIGVFLTALWLRLRRKRALSEPTELRLDTGTSVFTGLVLGRWHWNPLLRLQLQWRQPSAVRARLEVREGRLSEEIIPEERAWCEEVERVLIVGDVLGLARVILRWQAPQVVRFCPDRGGVKGLQLLQQLIPGDEQGHPDGRRAGDLLEMRGYGPGDPLKHVLWKTWARTGRLLVRTPEQALSPCDKTLAYFVAGPADEPSAGITRAVLESGGLGAEFLFAADGGTPTASVPEAIEQLVRSRTERAQGGSGLGSFLAEGESRGLRACLLFVPARLGPWLERVEQQLRCHHGPFRAIVGIDVLAERPPHSWLGRLLWQEVAESVVSDAEVREVCRRLEQTGADVKLVNRVTGELVVLTQSGENKQNGRK